MESRAGLNCLSESCHPNSSANALDGNSATIWHSQYTPTVKPLPHWITIDTHSTQRRIPLTIGSSSGTSYNLTLPSDPGIVLPGEYMLFALDATRVPSVAKMIRIS